MPQTATNGFYGWPPNLLYKGERHDEEYPGHGPGEQQDPSLHREDHTGVADGPRHHYPHDTMTAQGEDVLAWLDGVIKEREEAARACSAAPWAAEIPPMIHVSSSAIRDNKGRWGHLGYVATVEGIDDRSHIVLNDPEAGLRRCAADRKLLELHRPVEMTEEMADACATCEVTLSYPYYPCATILALAEGYGWTEAPR